jgi:hypothetical protein
LAALDKGAAEQIKPAVETANPSIHRVLLEQETLDEDELRAMTRDLERVLLEQETLDEDELRAMTRDLERDAVRRPSPDKPIQSPT